MAALAAQNVAPAHNLSKSARVEAAGIINDTVAADSTPAIIPRGDVIASVNFFEPPADGSVPFNYVKTPPEGQPKNNYIKVTKSVTIHDIRDHEDEYTLDKDAFKVVQDVPDSAEKDFTSAESIEKNYYPEVEKLLLDNVPGSHRVVFFDYTIRRANQESSQGPVLIAHVDQTAKAARQRVELHLGDEAEKLLQGRYRIINVWRPLNGPVASFPLAFASSSSIESEDLIAIEHRYPDRTGETAGVRYNAHQKWHYLSGMRNDERLLLECFDSEVLKEGSESNGVHGGRVPHSAFEDPRSPVGAPGRESIEVRTLVFGP
ncbi:unnamed protein product [Calypogeia fissa]